MSISFNLAGSPAVAFSNTEIDAKQQTNFGSRCVSYMTNGASSVGKLFYENSIFFALDNDAIARKKEEYKNLNFSQKVTLGVASGARHISASILIILALTLASKSVDVNEGNRATTVLSVDPIDIVIGAIFEELIFRGAIQNVIGISQSAANEIASPGVKENTVFKWLTSPSANIIGTNSLFAMAHLNNAGGYLSTLGAVQQVTRIMLMPTHSILYETTGGMIASISSHCTNNIITIMIATFLKNM